VISGPYADEDRALIGVIPHTTSLRGSQYEIKVTARFLQREGAFLLQGIATVPPAYFGRKLGSLPDAQMKEIENGLQGWLGL
jgi:mRNA interferase MazF